MKVKIVCFLLASCLLALAAWVVHRQNPSQANDVPEKYREPVHKGLEYLVKNQFQDGHWEGDDGQHPVAMTGLVGLALLMEESRTNSLGTRRGREGQYLDNICKAVDWLMDKSQAGRDGLIFSEHPSERNRYMQGHGLATLFLAGACEQEIDPLRRGKLLLILARAVKYILKAQSTQGGWYHTSKEEGHDLAETSATVIQIQALQADETVGIPVPHETVGDAQEYLKMAIEKYEDGAEAGQKRCRLAETAAALACRFAPFSGTATNNELCRRWLTYCRTEIPMSLGIHYGRDELAHYYFAQAVFFQGGDAWNDYRTASNSRRRSAEVTLRF